MFVHLSFAWLPLRLTCAVCLRCAEIRGGAADAAVHGPGAEGGGGPVARGAGRDDALTGHHARRLRPDQPEEHRQLGQLAAGQAA